MPELSLHIMNTALFYSSRMHLSPANAWKKVLPVLESATRHAGVLTINCHDRSIAPERLWGDFYCRLLDWLEEREPWFSTAAQAVCWFQRRRSATFESVERQEGSIRIKVKVPPDLDLPPMRLRIYEQLVLWPQQGGSSRLGEAYPRVMPALVGSDLRADRGLGNRTSPTGSPSEVPPSQEGNRHKRTQSSPRADACRGEASIWAE